MVKILVPQIVVNSFSEGTYISRESKHTESISCKSYCISFELKSDKIKKEAVSTIVSTTTAETK